MASSKFRVFSRSNLFAADGVFSPATRAHAFAQMAGDVIGEIDRENDAALGRDVKYRSFVDGRETQNLFAAKETSLIAARWELASGVIAYIDSLLATSGPVKSGAYRKLRAIYADGVEIDDPDKAATAREVMFVSLVPYGRKIERGRKGYSPGHVYEAVAALAKARFANVAQIKFTYAQPEGNSAPALQLRAWATLSAMRAGKGRRQNVKNLRQPAILVYL